MNVGKRIRKMREAQDMTPVHVAELTGLEAAYIEAVEEGREVPSIGAVLKISRALGSRMGQIIHGAGPRSDIFSIIPAGDGAAVERTSTQAQRTGQGYTYMSLLAADIRGQGMEPFLVTFDPQAAATVQPMAHEGEEFLYVLSGTLEMLYDGEVYTLKKGDSLYIDSARPHALRGIGKTPPQALAVILTKD
ncbi:MAG: cupin domain-containing protein [Deferrisomatales bacterium]|nr:cupin domain-containing protein [Deferrisomatales bacterium]